MEVPDWASRLTCSRCGSHNTDLVVAPDSTGGLGTWSQLSPLGAMAGEVGTYREQNERARETDQRRHSNTQNVTPQKLGTPAARIAGYASSRERPNMAVAVPGHRCSRFIAMIGVPS